MQENVIDIYDFPTILIFSIRSLFDFYLAWDNLLMKINVLADA